MSSPSFATGVPPATPPVYLTPHDALAGRLRTSGITGVTWSGKDPMGNTLYYSPYLNQAPEGAGLTFPYVVYEMPMSKCSPTFEKDYQEEFPVTVHVVATQETIATLSRPWGQVSESVLAFLDQFMDAPQALSGDGFECEQWLREGYEIIPDATRAPDGQRLWMASAPYKMSITAAYQPKR